MSLRYEYSAAKAYCEQIGLQWLGDNFLINVDAQAYELAFTQAQVDAALRHHLWQVKFLFTPQNYSVWQRIKLSIWFLFGRFKNV